MKQHQGTRECQVHGGEHGHDCKLFERIMENWVLKILDENEREQCLANYPAQTAPAELIKTHGDGLALYVETFQHFFN